MMALETMLPAGFPQNKRFDVQADLKFADGRVYRLPIFRLCHHGSGNSRDLVGCYCEVEAIERNQQEPITFQIHFLPSAFQKGIVSTTQYSVLLATRTWIQAYLTHNPNPPSLFNFDTPIRYWFR
jgi:hypothetical protein